MIWILLRAKIIIDSGTKYFNPFRILDNNQTIKITTQHGNGPKALVGGKTRFSALANKKSSAFDYIPQTIQLSSLVRVHLLPNQKLVT